MEWIGIGTFFSVEPLMSLHKRQESQTKEGPITRTPALRKSNAYHKVSTASSPFQKKTCPHENLVPAFSGRDTEAALEACAHTIASLIVGLESAGSVGWRTLFIHCVSDSSHRMSAWSIIRSGQMLTLLALVDSIIIWFRNKWSFTSVQFSWMWLHELLSNFECSPKKATIMLGKLTYSRWKRGANNVSSWRCDYIHFLFIYPLDSCKVGSAIL